MTHTHAHAPTMKSISLLFFAIIISHASAQLANLFNTFLNPQGSGVYLKSFLNNGEDLPAYQHQSQQRGYGRRGRRTKPRGISGKINGLLESVGGVEGLASGFGSGLGTVASTLGLGGSSSSSALGGGPSGLLQTFGTLAQSGALPQLLGSITSGGDLKQLPLQPLNQPIVTNGISQSRLLPPSTSSGIEGQRGVDPDKLAQILGPRRPQVQHRTQFQLTPQQQFDFQRTQISRQRTPQIARIRKYQPGTIPRRLGSSV